MKGDRSWSDDERELLKSLYPDPAFSAEYISIHIGKSVKGIYDMARKMGLKRVARGIRGKVKDDLTNGRFGSLTVIGPTDDRSFRNVIWKCVCDCGREVLVRRNSLVTHDTRSCGKCRNDLTGRRFGSLQPIEIVGRDDGRNILWRCECDCGRSSIIQAGRLMSGGTMTCGRCSEINVGDQFGYLTIMEATNDRKHRNVMWRCLCRCGKETKVMATNLKQGITTSCGCRRLIDYDGLRFRSNWEVWFYLAARAKNVQVQYETITISLPDMFTKTGLHSTYTPDFVIHDSGRMIEIKGRRFQVGMQKLESARRAGYDISLIDGDGLTSWCECSLEEMAKVQSAGGISAVDTLIRSRLNSRPLSPRMP